MRESKQLENTKRLEVLYRESHQWFLAATFNIVKDKDVAEDLVGELYIYLAEKVNPSLWWGKSFNVMYCYAFLKSRFLNKVKRDKKIQYQANTESDTPDNEYDIDSDERIDTAYNQVIDELKNMERTKLWPASKLAQLYFFDDKMTLEKLSAEIKICKSTSFTQIKRAKKHLRETIDNPFRNEK
jgi:DNA-directed RNA polymerase specialized sigma24 family protein